MKCKVINDKLTKNSKLNIDDIFATTEKQKNKAVEFTLRMNIRSSLILGHMAYQGSQILDIGTPAMAGGAWERRGLPLFL